MGKQNVVYPYNALLFSLKGKEILQYTTTWMKSENITDCRSQKSQSQKEWMIALA
jgi:hypothetical protein